MKKIHINELAEKCKGTKLIVLAGRDDEKNTLYATKVCRYLSGEEKKKCIYFSLRLEKEMFMGKYSDAPVIIDDTPGLEIEELLKRVKSAINSGEIDLIVIDYLNLLSDQEVKKTRKEELESIVEKLKLLSEEMKVPILLLILLSKYVPKDYPILQEFGGYGDILRFLDEIAYADLVENRFLVLRGNKKRMAQNKIIYC